MINESQEPVSQDNLGWYLAEIVIRILVEGDRRIVAHKNLILIKAKNALDAYDRAMIVGKEHTMSYKNPQGQQVDIEFLGLSRLNAVYDRLEDGAELLYHEFVGISEVELRELVVPKNLLSVFRESEPSRGPDYSSVEVLREAASGPRFPRRP